MSDLPLLGVEEEFHVVDLATRRAAPEVDALLTKLDGAEFAPELQRSLVETNTPVCGTLDELRGHIRRALDNGVTKEEISEVITHMAFYSGWPTAANAVQVAKQVFDSM